MNFHPGRLGIMTPKGETLPEGDIQKIMREEREKQKEAEERCKSMGSSYFPYSISMPQLSTTKM